MSPTTIPGTFILQSPASNDPLLDLNTQPSLDLQFATGKTLDDRVSGLPLVNHQRDASSGKSAGTYVGSDGLIKTSPVNMLTYSDYSQVEGTSSATLEGLAIAPDGTNTARRYSALSSDRAINKVVTSGTAGADYTFSVYVRSTGVASQVRLQVGNTTYTEIFNISTEWQRLDITKVNNSDTFVRAYVRLVNSGDEVEVWGAQLEEGSTASTYVPTTNLPSGAPRFDHDPVTGESLGLLIEESRTNLLTYSERFDQWNPTNIAVATNATTAPDGASTAAKLSSTTGTWASFCQQNFAGSGTRVLSVFAKAAESSWIAAGGIGSGGELAWFNLSTGLPGAKDPNVLSSSMEAFPDGWYRCSLVCDFQSYGGVVPVSGDNSINIAPVGDGIFIWGAQLEAGSFPTSYIPTTSSTVTRAADAASITGTNFSSWYNSTAGDAFMQM